MLTLPATNLSGATSDASRLYNAPPLCREDILKDYETILKNSACKAHSQRNLPRVKRTHKGTLLGILKSEDYLDSSGAEELMQQTSVCLSTHIKIGSVSRECSLPAFIPA